VLDRVDGRIRAVYRDAGRVHTARAQCVTTIFFAKDTFYAEMYSYKYITFKTRMWANAQPDGRPAEPRWRPLFNAAKFG